nr:hypothetical protein [Tanacetum cinerariifolium]
MDTESGYTNMSEKDKGKMAVTCSHIGNESLAYDRDDEQNTLLRLQSPTKFGSISENDKGKNAATCSYAGNQSLVVDIGGSEYGLHGGSVDDGGCGSADGCCGSLIRPPFVTDIPGTRFTLDFENSTVRLPTATDDTKGLHIGFDFGDNQIVMDFQNSSVYMLSNKGGVTNIAT